MEPRGWRKEALGCYYHDAQRPTEGTVVLRRGKGIVDSRDGWVIRVVRVVRDLVGRDGTVVVWVSAIGHHVGIVKLEPD